MVDSEILEFIERRFSKDCDWLSGNCYWFAAILCSRFRDKLCIWYDPVAGHFYAADILGTIFYDWAGAHMNLENKVYRFEDIMHDDFSWFSRLVRDCVM